MNKPSNIGVLIVVSIVALGLCILASLSFGARFISFLEVIETLLYSRKTSINEIIVYERIPRTIFGIIAGAALGISGVLMQSITRNPIADPSILGVNTGASLFVVGGIAFFQISTSSEYIAFALVGAALTTIFVYSIGSMGQGGATPIKLALAGVATSAALSSIISSIILTRNDIMNTVRFWQVGSIGGATWEGILAILPFIIVGFIITVVLTPSLDALSMGDDIATGLGVRTGTVRLLAAFAGVLLCGATTALAGPIGFVGIMVPHTVRLICGPNLKKIIPMSAVGGAILLVFADIIGRLLGSPSEVEAGIVTAFIGAPILVTIAMRAKVRAL